MKVKKYKFLGASRYKLFFDDEEYILYEDIILKYNILLREDLTKKDFENFLLDNCYYEAYYKALKYIEIKLRTKKEVIKYLEKNDFSKEVIKDVVSHLDKDGFLNQEIYAKAYVNDQIVLKMNGPLKIENDLISLGISKDIARETLKEFDDSLVEEKLNKLIDKVIKSNKNKSSYYIKNKIVVQLVNLGYRKEDILNVLNEKTIDDSDAYKIEYDKLYKKYKDKYHGSQLEYVINQKMYAKGFKKSV